MTHNKSTIKKTEKKDSELADEIKIKEAQELLSKMTTKRQQDCWLEVQAILNKYNCQIVAQSPVIKSK